MKVLTSTMETQGQRDNDFCFVPEGELVHIGIECDRDHGDPDGYCGCVRSMVGVECHKSTTTMKVVEQDITPEEYNNKILQSFKDSGWIDEEVTESDSVTRMCESLLQTASSFEVDDIVEKRGIDFKRRI
jgi:hypothetical protein